MKNMLGGQPSLAIVIDVSEQRARIGIGAVCGKKSAGARQRQAITKFDSELQSLFLGRFSDCCRGQNVYFVFGRVKQPGQVVAQLVDAVQQMVPIGTFQN